MKTLTITSLLTLLNINFKLIPNADLLLVMSLAIVLDFVTGVAKSVILKKARTSEGYRKTVVKFLQYGGALAAGGILKHLSGKQSDMVSLDKYITYCNTGLLIFIIFIEVTSILENISEMDRKTPFSIYFIQPLLRIMTFQIRNNALTRQDPKNLKKEAAE
jgi:phage-related holin